MCTGMVLTLKDYSYGMSHTDMLHSVFQNWSTIFKRHLNSLETILLVHPKMGRKTVFTWSRAPLLSVFG